MKKVIRWVVAMVALTVYLNIGWAVGTYLHNNVSYSVPQSFTAKVLAGPYSMLSSPSIPEHKRASLLFGQMLCSIIWPLPIMLIPGLLWIVYALSWIAWIVFAGGLAKLFGIG